MNTWVMISLVVFSFLCGSVPTGYLLMKHVKHRDIRKIGSGNIGSTNVKRAAGTGLSLLTQVIDILKGLIPAALAILLGGRIDSQNTQSVLISAVALASILGHDFSPFLGFRGGKGVNTTVGAFLVTAPLPVLTGVAIYYGLRPVTSIVSVRSLALGVGLATATTVSGLAPAIITSSWIAAVLIIIRHRSNLQRLIQHSEPG